MTESWLMISAGQGPAECQWVVARLIDTLCAEAEAAGLAARLLETVTGEHKQPRSALIGLTGKNASTFAQNVEGTVQWIGPSPFRPKHKRKNWYAAVFALTAPEESPHLREQDVSFQTMKASGPGGQHVNTTDSAVRAVHVPTGVTVIAREERSQHANKRLALVKLTAYLEQAQSTRDAAQDKDRWQHHYRVEQGNPTRIYAGPAFKRR